MHLDRVTASPSPAALRSGISTAAQRAAEYMPQLDGLRAAAVIAVAWSHWERPYQFGIPFGAGVHLFYVLSGFLITGILVRLRDSAERGRAMKAFYFRRALRIFPAFYLTLVLAWWADLPLVRESVWWHAAYLSNVFTLMRGEWPGTISHLWSLAVEEQFYLLWPWLIVFAPRRWMVPGVIVAILSAPLARWWLAALGYPESMLAILPIGCFDSLGIGALIALKREALTPSRPLLIVLLIASSALLVAEARDAPIWITVVNQTVQACVFGWFVLGAANGFDGAVGRALASAPILYIGRISYGVYLAHGFAGAMAAGMFSVLGYAWPLPEPWRLIVLALVTLGAASLSWHLVERPLNALKRRVPYRAR